MLSEIKIRKAFIKVRKELESIKQELGDLKKEQDSLKGNAGKKKKSTSKKAYFIASKHGGKYHKTTCPLAQNIKNDAQVVLKSQTEALNKEYKQCKDCQS